ncbi:MAG: hypothetical protein R3300_03215, partial [Candidatus Promineifilaceae bacterium]|nr:hypothetical protein [Candidatus Promineifilaceae bacterium]
REIRIAADHQQATLTVIHHGNPEIMYRMYARLPEPAVYYAYIAPETGRPVEASDAITAAAGPLSLHEITPDDIIRHFIRKYKSVSA